MHEKCQIQDYQNKNRLSGCRIHSLPLKPKLGRMRPAGRWLDIEGLNSRTGDGAMAIGELCPTASGTFLDTKSFANSLTCALFNTVNAIITIYYTRMQQWICKPLMRLSLNNR